MIITNPYAELPPGMRPSNYGSYPANFDERAQRHIASEQAAYKSGQQGSLVHEIGGSYIPSNSYENLSSVLQTLLNGLSSSALDAELAAADRVNSFNAEQAEINRLFQQSSAEKAMQFSADQAEINRNFQQSSAEKAMQFSADQAQKQMDFQERMSNTAYQRAVQDLKAAGLSPLLAYSNFRTSSPSGSSGVGYSSSGTMASGVTSSGSSASGVKANPSAGKTADLSPFNNVFSALIALGVSAVADVAEWSSKVDFNPSKAATILNYKR